MRAPSVGFWLSVLVHGTILGGGAILLQSPAQFGVDAGRSSVDVNLVAAAPDSESVPPPPTESSVSEETPPQPPEPDDLTIPLAPPTPQVALAPVERPVDKTPTPPVPKPVRRATAHTVEKGDGSSPKPGKDATTASSDGGAIVDGKPDYLRNPPPVYPESARQARQEGLVVLQVIVNAEGRPDSVVIRTGSGFNPLDEAAVKAVRNWRFRPASLGGVKVRSRVVVPVRFRLDA